MKTEMPLHHYPVTTGMSTGDVYLTPEVWGAFVSSILAASDTIDARRASRQTPSKALVSGQADNQVTICMLSGAIETTIARER